MKYIMDEIDIALIKQDAFEEVIPTGEIEKWARINDDDSIN